MKKVKMILTNRFSPDVRVLKEALYLASLGLDIEILCWDRENDYLEREIESIDGIKIKRFYPYAKYGSGKKQIISYLKFLVQVRKYLSKETYEYLHCHDLDGMIVGCFLGNKKVKRIFDMHEMYEVQQRNKRFRSLVRLLVLFLQNKSTAIIYVNDLQKKLTKAHNHNKMIYLPNYPSGDEYITEKTQYENLRVAYIGVVRQYEELKNLVNASLSIESLNVAINGNGVAYEGIKEYVSSKSLGDKVKVTGFYHYKESTDLYMNTDVLYAVYPNDSLQGKELFPVKFYEAIITQTPIIVNMNTKMADFVNQYDIGFVVDGGDIDSIKSVLEFIASDREMLKKKRDNIKKIQFQYNWNFVVKNLKSIY